MMNRKTHRPAFTLIELVVVLGIITVLAVTTLPLIASMWRDNKLVDAENRIGGLVRSARMRAYSAKEAGLFFFVEFGEQKIAFIESEPFDPSSPADLGPDGVVSGDDVKPQDTVDRFRITDAGVYTLSAPVRACPLSVLDDGQWQNEELANENYNDDAHFASLTGPRNHRNFFTIIYSAEGHPIVNRTVLIHDPPAVNAPTTGTFTQLPVGATGQYQDNSGAATGNSPGGELPDMLFVGAGVALNFPSSDGLLVYDDSPFRELPDESANPYVLTQRRYLAQHGRPLYLGRQSGSVIRGPIAEKSD